MRFILDQNFLNQRRKYDLRFTCEHCAHFDPEREACVHGYPVAEHRVSNLDSREGDLVFCKEFELR